MKKGRKAEEEGGSKEEGKDGKMGGRRTRKEGRDGWTNGRMEKKKKKRVGRRERKERRKAPPKKYVAVSREENI